MTDTLFTKEYEKSLQEYKEKSISREELSRHAVTGSTFRAYTERRGCYKKPKNPSAVYREWVDKFLDLLLKDNCDDFKKLHDLAHDTLKKYWEENSGGKLQKYQINKLVDLTFKFLPKLNVLPKQKQDWLFQNVNVPLDKYSLVLLKRLSEKYKSIIPKHPSMNNIDEVKLKYDEVQDEIKKICKNLHISPVEFDILARNAMHPVVK